MYETLEPDSVLPSQPTLSRLVGLLNTPTNQEVVREGIIELTVRRLWKDSVGRRRKRLMIDLDGLPLEVHGQQAGSEYNGYYGQRMSHALVASCAESGDLGGGIRQVRAISALSATISLSISTSSGRSRSARRYQ